MQPQDPNKPQPTPTPSYDFILKGDQKQARKGWGLPNLSGGSFKWVMIGLALAVVIIFYILLSGGKNNGSVDNLTPVLGKAQEIKRVSSIEQPQLKDPAVIDLAVTAQATLSSEQAQINNYLKGLKLKTDAKKLAAYQSKSTDSKLQTAAQNSELDQAYLSYLRQALNDYANSLKTAYAATSSATVKQMLKDAFDSTQTLLSSPQFKNTG